MGCKRCGAPVSGTAEALTKKLVNRGIRDFFCLGCLSDHFRISRNDLLAMAETYRKNGCTLFPPPGEPIRFRGAVLVTGSAPSAAYRALPASALFPAVPPAETGFLFLTPGDFTPPGTAVTQFPEPFPEILLFVYNLLEEARFRRILLLGSQDGRSAALVAERGMRDTLPPDTSLSFFPFVQQLLEKQNG